MLIRIPPARRQTLTAAGAVDIEGMHLPRVRGRFGSECKRKRLQKERKAIPRLFLRLGFRGNLCRLPGDGLPFVAAFYERAGIEVTRYFSRALFFGGGDQAKSDDRSVAVLQDADVFAAVSGNTFVRFLGRGRFGFRAAKNIGFAETLAGGTGVNELICPEPLVHRHIVAAGAIEKFFQELFQGGGIRSGGRW